MNREMLLLKCLSCHIRLGIFTRVNVCTLCQSTEIELTPWNEEKSDEKSKGKKKKVIKTKLKVKKINKKTT